MSCDKCDDIATHLADSDGDGWNLCDDCYDWVIRIEKLSEENEW